MEHEALLRQEQAGQDEQHAVAHRDPSLVALDRTAQVGVVRRDLGGEAPGMPKCVDVAVVPVLAVGAREVRRPVRDGRAGAVDDQRGVRRCVRPIVADHTLHEEEVVAGQRFDVEPQAGDIDAACLAHGAVLHAGSLGAAWTTTALPPKRRRASCVTAPRRARPGCRCPGVRCGRRSSRRPRCWWCPAIGRASVRCGPSSPPAARSWSIATTAASVTCFQFRGDGSATADRLVPLSVLIGRVTDVQDRDGRRRLGAMDRSVGVLRINIFRLRRLVKRRLWAIRTMGERS